jgi:hypothetical protein
VLLAGGQARRKNKCGTKCLQNGQPIGLLTKSGLLADGEEHDPRCDSLTSLRQAAAEKFREDRGSYRQRDGVRQLQAIFVSGYVKK